MNANMSLEDREAKIKQLSKGENRLSLTSDPTNTNNNSTNHIGSASGQGLGPSKAVTFSAEGSDGDGNELSEEDMRYVERPNLIAYSTTHPFTLYCTSYYARFQQSIP